MKYYYIIYKEYHACKNTNYQRHVIFPGENEEIAIKNLKKEETKIIKITEIFGLNEVDEGAYIIQEKEKEARIKSQKRLELWNSYLKNN